KKLGISYTDDPPILTRTARKALRQKFLTADMGISGCNLACAETGHITTVSNEGNIRMATTLPRVHVAFMGMERVTARLEDHDILFRLPFLEWSFTAISAPTTPKADNSTAAPVRISKGRFR
ncbi:MAG: LUD domain-containing protein, partial [Desulfobacterales bacterium]